MIVLIGLLGRNFKTRSGIEDALPLVQPSTGKLKIDVERNNLRYYSDDWFGVEWDEDMPFYGSNADTLMLNTVRVNVVKSKDDQFHIYRVRFSRSNGSEAAKDLAGKIQFDMKQQDSLVTLPRGFAVSKDEKFRNQQVLMIVEVPVGKKIQLQEGVKTYDWFTVNINRRRGINVEVDAEWDNSYSWNAGQEYEMTEGGLERTDYRVRDYQPGGKYYQEPAKTKTIDTAVIDGREKPQPADNRYRYRQDARERIDTVTRRTVVSELAIPVAVLSNLL
ncbi:MAG: hypothetical protein EOO02_17285 [Chitinophagaceae bacterium]|nr:MAG: hypothetical protein EOO02_17285 [Chitinophagaceae bacterium]